MRFTLPALVTAFTARILLADQAGLIVPVDGAIYSNVTWGTVTPATVTLFHATGVATVPLENLPRDLQQRFGYDAEKARAYRESVQKAEFARWEAWQKQQAERRAQQAREDAERQAMLAQRSTEMNTRPTPVTELRFVSVANRVPLGPEVYRAVLVGADGNGVTVRFDGSGRRFLDAAMDVQEQIQAMNEQRRNQAEAARGINYSSAIVVTPYSTTVKESPPLSYTKLDPKVFTVYAIRMNNGTYRLIGSQRDPQREGAAGISW